MNEKILNLTEIVVKFIFSWVILLPIAVIVSGKFLAQPIKLKVYSKQLFKISLNVLEVQATDDEVILGFTGFIITLFILAIARGPEIYLLVKTNFGVDAGHFNSLCVFSSFLMVLLSFSIFLLNCMFGVVSSKLKDQTMVERDKLIDKLGNNLRGGR